MEPVLKSFLNTDENRYIDTNSRINDRVNQNIFYLYTDISQCTSCDKTNKRTTKVLHEK